MIQSTKLFLLPILSSFLLLSLSACDPSGSGSTGEVEIQITDAPADDASIQGVFVTVADVKVDGQSYSGFNQKTTIDLMAYQEGKSKVLGLSELEAGSYQEITLVLDTETDASGNSPGCYVLTTNDEKIDLNSSASSTIEISTDVAFELLAEARSSVVIDFDLRKSIQYEGSSSSSFSFVSQSNLNSSIRAVLEANSGRIEGEFSGSGEADKVVVYAYKKGTFDKDTEVQGNGSVQFHNAVSSTLATKTSAGYEYELAFLEEGEYEVCLVGYNDDDQDGQFELEGFLQSSVLIGGSVTNLVTVEAGVSVSLSLVIAGLIQ